MLHPTGSNLTISELLAALEWKIDNEELEKGLLPMSSTVKDSDVEEKDGNMHHHHPLENQTKQSVKLIYLANRILPINCLPIEILTRIFSLVQNVDAHQFPPPDHYYLLDHESWRYINLVCRSWRHICLNTPFLWRYLAMYCDSSSPRTPVTLYIDRSSPGPLEVSIEYVGEDGHDDEAEMRFRQLSQSIIHNRHRVQALYISMFTPKVSECTSVLEILQHDFPNLKRLHLEQGRNNATAPFQGGCVPALFTSPIEKLQLIEFIDLPPPNSASHLKELFLKFPKYSNPSNSNSHFEQFLDFLQTCPLLETVYLHLMDWDVPLHCPLRKVHLPALKHIELFTSNFSDEPFLFHNLVMPTDVKILWPCTLIDHNVGNDAKDRTFKYPPASYLETVTEIFVQNCCGTQCEIFQHAFIMTFDTMGLTHMNCGNKAKRDSLLAGVMKSLPRLFPNIRSLTLKVFFLEGFSLEKIFRDYLSLERLQIAPYLLSTDNSIRLQHLDNGCEMDEPLLPSLRQINIQVENGYACQKIERKALGATYLISTTEDEIKLPPIESLRCR